MTPTRLVCFGGLVFFFFCSPAVADADAVDLARVDSSMLALAGCEGATRVVYAWVWSVCGENTREFDN